MVLNPLLVSISKCSCYCIQWYDSSTPILEISEHHVYHLQQSHHQLKQQRHRWFRQNISKLTDFDRLYSMVFRSSEGWLLCTGRWVMTWTWPWFWWKHWPHWPRSRMQSKSRSGLSPETGQGQTAQCSLRQSGAGRQIQGQPGSKNSRSGSQSRRQQAQT